MRACPVVPTERIFYCYIYFSALDGSPFYVGKGRGRRSLSHLKKTHNEALQAKIGQLGRDNIRIERIAQDITEAQAFACESAIIQFYGRVRSGAGPLLNVMRGAQGGFAKPKRGQEAKSALDYGQWNQEAVRRRLEKLWDD